MAAPQRIHTYLLGRLSTRNNVVILNMSFSQPTPSNLSRFNLVLQSFTPTMHLYYSYHVHHSPLSDYD